MHNTDIESGLSLQAFNPQRRWLFALAVAGEPLPWDWRAAVGSYAVS